MRSQDGKTIKAIAKEKEQARKEYDASIRQGRTAGLIEHATDDGETPFRRNSLDVHCRISFSYFSGCLAG